MDSGRQPRLLYMNITVLDARPWDRLPSWGSAAPGPPGKAGERFGSIVARLGTERVTGRVVPSNWCDDRSTGWGP